MPGPMLQQFYLAIGAKLGLGEGSSVLDAGAACGHGLAVLQQHHRNKLRAMGVDGALGSVRYARQQAPPKARTTVCHGDVRTLAGIEDDAFDAAYTAGTMALLSQPEEVCAAAKALGRVLKPGGRAVIASVPKDTCAVTQDAEWDCPRCFWKLKSVSKEFWASCLKGGGEGLRVQLLSNTDLFPAKPAAYCQREHYSVLLHKKHAASVYVFEVPKPKLAVLTVSSTPPTGEYGKQKMHYLTELSVENKRQYAQQHGFELVVAQNLQHGRTARWDKVMMLRQLLRKYEWLHWVDLDTLFMNLKRNPNEFLDPAYDLHVAKDANGLNTGSFYVRSSAWSERFLKLVWEHNDGGRGESDQRSFKHVIDNVLSADERAKHVRYYSQKVFNEYPDPIVNFKNWRGHFREGDFLLHFPGTFCGLSPSGVYTDQHLLECLHRVIIHFVAAV